MFWSEVIGMWVVFKARGMDRVTMEERQREDSLGTDKALGKVRIPCRQRRGVNRRMSLQKLQDFEVCEQKNVCVGVVFMSAELDLDRALKKRL